MGKNVYKVLGREDGDDLHTPNFLIGNLYLVMAMMCIKIKDFGEATFEVGSAVWRQLYEKF